MSISVMRTIAFDTAHRLVGHEGKCANLHGHRYVAELHARADALDAVGRVVDFSVLKERVGGWIDAHWDHNGVFSRDDPDGEFLQHISNGKPLYRLPVNPTAENLAYHLLHVVCPSVLKGYGVCVFRITLHETPNCSATVELDAYDAG
jgi:6-pyruvoyltetrahydropterin/6-carboxytetrahydropterin synthase